MSVGTGFLGGDLFYRAQAARFGARPLAETDGAGIGVGPDPRGDGLRLLASGDVGEIVELLLDHPVTDLTSAQAPAGTLAELRRRTGTGGAVPEAAAPWASMTTGRGWDLLATTTPPPLQPGEDRVRALSADEAREVVPDVLAEAYPDTWALTHLDELSWTGFLEADSWLAVMATNRAPMLGGGEVAVLSGLGTRPAHRGRGVGSAVTCAIVRRELGSGAEAVQLGTWTDVVGPRRLYESLGFRFVQQVENIVPAA
ncbi:MAG: GNAT family N-acetyltransferase [Actinomycetaceae bacterium]